MTARCVPGLWVGTHVVVAVVPNRAAVSSREYPWVAILLTRRGVVRQLSVDAVRGVGWAP